MISYYQKEKPKTAPKIEILDAHGKTIRTVTIKSDDDKAGLNRYVWDFQNDGPVKWSGAAKKAYQGPDEGVGVPPGHYSVRMTLARHTYVQPITIKPDPRSAFTQAQYQASYDLGNALNALDATKKALDAATADPKAKADAALTASIAAAQTQRAAIFSTLTADFHNDEDSIQRPGALREDYQQLYYAAQGLVTPSTMQYFNRLQVRYRSAIAQYNAFVNTLAPIDASLTTDKLKPIPATVKAVAP